MLEVHLKCKCTHDKVSHRKAAAFRLSSKIVTNAVFFDFQMTQPVNGFYDQYDMASKRVGYPETGNGFGPFFGNLGSLGSNGLPWTPLSGTRLDGEGFIGLNGSAWTPVTVQQSESSNPVLTLLDRGAARVVYFLYLEL